MEQSNLRLMTIEEFDRLPEDNTKTYELIDGKLVMQARPNVRHQAIMSNLTQKIANYLDKKPCRVFTEVELEISKNVIVPDVSVLCSIENLNIQRFTQPPVLVIEILSPSNTANEINNKINKYKNHGIKECWVIDPDLKSVEVKDLETNISINYIQSGLVKSDIFDDLHIELSKIFE